MIDLRKAGQRGENAKKLLLAAVHAFAKLEEQDMLSAWQHFGTVAGCSSEELRKYRVALGDQEIEAIAGIALRDSLLNQEWLSRWLRATAHSDREKVIDRLLGADPSQPKSMMTHNLTPWFPRRRHTPIFSQLIAALERQAAIVILESESGWGKTSALREVAWHCVFDDKRRIFQNVVWIVPTKDEPSPLDRVLTDILLTTNEPGLIDLTLAQKRERVKDLVLRVPTLVVIDGLDRYEDKAFEGNALLQWLQELPSPSKALVSTTKPLAGVTNCALSVSMPPLEREEYVYHSLITELRRHFPDVNISREDLELIQDVTGNPRMMYLIAVRLHIWRARQGKWAELKDAFEDISLEEVVCQQCDLLSENGWRVLLSLLPFPFYATLVPLRYVAVYAQDWPSNDAAYNQAEDWFHGAVAELVRLGLVYVVRSPKNEELGIEWDEIVDKVAHDAFASRVTQMQSFYASEAALYRGWVRGYCRLSMEVGYCPDDHAKLKLLDSEMYVLPKVIAYVADHEDFAEEALLLSAGCSYFYYVRGHWAKHMSPHRVAFQQAARLYEAIDSGEKKSRFDVAEVLAAQLKDLAFEVEWLSKRRQFEQIERNGYLELMEQLVGDERTPNSARLICLIGHAYYLMEHNRDYVRAEQMLRQALGLSQSATGNGVSLHLYAETKYTMYFAYVAMYRLAACMAVTNMDAANDYLTWAIEQTKADPRTRNRMRLQKATLLIDRVRQTADGGVDRVSEVEELLAEVGGEIVAPKDAEALERLLQLHRQPHREEIMAWEDPTEAARFLEAWGRYDLLLGKKSGLHLLRNAQKLYHQLSRPSLVERVEQAIERSA